MIDTRAPGKLFIAGEYAVVEAGEPAVLVAVDRFLYVRLHERVSPDDAAGAASSTHVSAALATIDELRRERGLPERFFEIETKSELDEADGRKFGLGSSAAVTVATIDALNRLYELGLTAHERFRLALLATIEVSPKASGGDLAASTFGGWLRYSSPDRDALRAHRLAHGVTSALQSDAWQACSIKRLPTPQNLSLLVGWTGSPASTESLVGKAGEGDASSAQAFLTRSRGFVDAFCLALTSAPAPGSDEAAFAAVRHARTLLQRLGEDRGIVIETAALSELCTIAERYGAAAKSSGAGGGDCGIALAGLDSDIASILREWEQHGITPLDLQVFAPSRQAEGDADER